jgi:hypothetical protein
MNIDALMNAKPSDGCRMSILVKVFNPEINVGAKLVVTSIHIQVPSRRSIANVFHPHISLIVTVKVIAGRLYQPVLLRIALKLLSFEGLRS